MNTYTVHVGESSNDLVWNCLGYTLKHDFGAPVFKKYGGTGGSVDVWWYEAEINGSLIVIEWENWNGVEISGPKTVVDEIVEALHKRTENQCL